MWSLPAETQTALKLRLQAIAELDPRKSLEIYKEARKALNVAALTSPHARYLKFMSYYHGGWGKLASRKFAEYLKRQNDTDPLYSVMNVLCRGGQFNFTSEGAGHLIANGDFTCYEAMVSVTYKCGVHTNALCEVGSHIGAIAKHERDNTFNLRPYLTGFNRAILARYANQSSQNLARVLKLFTFITVEKTRIYAMTRLLVLLRGKNITPALHYYTGQFINENSNSGITAGGDPSWVGTMAESTEYYLTRKREHQARALAWMWCAKGLVCRDIAIMIGKFIYNCRHEWVE